jgi:hypothetical protein
VVSVGCIVTTACGFPEFEFAPAATGGAANGGTGSDTGSAGAGGSGGTVTGGNGSGSTGGSSGGGTGGELTDPCADGDQNGDETDVDCGGGTCGLCAMGKGCESDADCASMKCDSVDYVCVPGLVLQCKCYTCANGPMNSSQVGFTLTNNTAAEVALKDYVVRYYFERENSGDYGLCALSDVPGNCAAFDITTEAYGTAEGASDVIEFAFKSTSVATLAVSQVSGETNIRVQAVDGENVDQQNDYSFRPDAPSFIDCPNMVLIRKLAGVPGGSLVWGTPAPRQ